MNKLFLLMVAVFLVSCSKSEKLSTNSVASANTVASAEVASNPKSDSVVGSNDGATVTAKSSLGYMELDKATQDNVNKVNPLNVAKGKVKVTEFFSYGCIHCYHLESALEGWMAANPNVEIQKVHIVWGNEAFKSLSRLSYTVKIMGLNPRINLAIFRAIFDEKLDLTNEEVLRTFLSKNSINPTQFITVYDSFGVANIPNSNDILTQAYGVSATPIFVVNNKYVTTPALPEDLLKTLTILVKKEAK